MAPEGADRRRPRGRLAPSPTGALHLGNARTFLIAWLSLRSRGGSVVFRMEDLDHPRVKAGAADEAMEDLRWLGLDWDEGPDIGGPCAPYVQSQRIPRYAEALRVLLDQDLVYPCVCSRSDVEEAQSAPHDTANGLYYPGTCRGRFADWDEAAAALPPGRIPAWRFRAPPEPVLVEDGFHGRRSFDLRRELGDFALARHRDGAGYMLAVVVDDAAMGITEVVRGDDLLASTPRQLLLYRALGLPEPRFVHLPLVVGPDGHRLAKRHGDTRIRALREAGVEPARVVGLLAHWCGWAAPGEAITPAGLLHRYDLSRVPNAPVVLDSRLLRRLGPGAEAGR